MDVARPKQKKTGRNILIGAGVLAIVAVTVALFRLQPAAPSVDAGPLWRDSVVRGDMVRDVRGPGTLVPEHIRQVVAAVSGRIDRLVSEAGQPVTPETVLIEMSNPDEQIITMQAQQTLSQAQQTLMDLRNNLAQTRLSQTGAVATLNTQYLQARDDYVAAESLLAHKLTPPMDASHKRELANELRIRLDIEKQRLAMMTQVADSQIAAQANHVELLRAIYASRQNKLKSLQVKAGDVGVLQDLSLQLGQWITEGALVAKVVQPGKLKAVLRIPESQAKDVQIGQPAKIDTRNGMIDGHVSRKDPSSQAGTITVDVALDGALPAGAVPDLSVDGTIVIELLKNVLHVGRPAYGAGTGTVGLFKVVDGGSAAVRVSVELGANSVNTVEVKRGLAAKDIVILSDMSQWDAYDRVRLK